MRIEIPLSDVHLKARDRELYQVLAERFSGIQDPRERLTMFEVMCRWFGEGQIFGSAKIRGVIIDTLMKNKQ